MSLTKSDRDKICYAILGEAFSDRIMQLALRRRALAYRVHSMVVDIEAVEGLGAPWVTYEATTFRVKCEGEVYTFDLEGEPERTHHKLVNLFGPGRVGWHSDNPGVAVKVPLPYARGNIGHIPARCFTVESDLLFVDEYRTIALEYDGLAKEIEQRAGEVYSILNSTRSAATLAKKWPEIKDHIPAELFDKPKTKSKTSASELTKALGLKKD